MDAELHIVGIVVHAVPDSVPEIALRLATMPGTEVHATSPDGKLVVTLEAASAHEIAARIEHIQQLDRVMSAALVYQHADALEAMMEEISDEDHEA